MRTRPLVVGAVSAVGLLAVGLVLARSGGPPPARTRETREAKAPPAGPPAQPVAPETLRNVFRFTDRSEVPPKEPPKFLLDEPVAAATASPGPRLVGLLRRSGRTVAALAVDGEVVLAGQGESVSGITVVEIGDESVRIRGEDGDESTLVLP